MVFSNEEIEKFRGDTPGCVHRVHLNNAGAALMPFPVLNAIQEHLTFEARVGGYEAADLRHKEIEKFYHSAARLLNTRSRNIAFTANATDSFCRAVSSIPLKKGDVILTTNEDYISNQILYLSFVKRFGIELVRVKSLESGVIDLEELEKNLKKTPKLVAVTHVPTNSGLIQPIKEIGEMCRRYDTLYLIDACQSIGQLRLDVDELQCDFLSVTSRKFLRGPRGAGFLYISDRVLEDGFEPLFIDMRGADWVEADKYIARDTAVRFEDWEFAYSLLLGTGAAIDYLLQLDILRIKEQLQSLSSYLRNELTEIDRVTVQDRGPSLAALVTFHMQGSNADFIKAELLKERINVVTSIRNFAVIDYDRKGVDWTIRVSPHYYNTREELDLFLDVVKRMSKSIA
jgi:selenocysteine lyase/cysteine desulfurase